MEYRDEDRNSSRLTSTTCEPRKKKIRTDKQKKSKFNLEKATRVIRKLLCEYPNLMPELVSLLHLVDNGEVAILSGIKNRDIRSGLKKLLPLLGVEKVKSRKGAYQLTKGIENPALVQQIENLLCSDINPPKDPLSSIDEIKTESNQANENVKHTESRFVGPMLPPSGSLPQSSLMNTTISDSDEEVIGPALPNMKGFRRPDAAVEAKVESMRTTDKADTFAKSVQREEWMTMMPKDQDLAKAFVTDNKNKGKPAAFRSKDPLPVDSTWFDAPEERDRAARAKMDMELLGYVRKENEGTVTHDPGPSHEKACSHQHHGDHVQKQQMEHLQLRRGPSLLQQYQESVAGSKKQSSYNGPKRWDRDRDLTSSRNVSRAEAERIIEDSKQVYSKFTAPTIARQFL